jgi:hypothetical protein
MSRRAKVFKIVKETYTFEKYWSKTLLLHIERLCFSYSHAVSEFV